MKSLLFQFFAVTIVLLLAGCGGIMTFEDQIKRDVKSKMATGICDDIPENAKISNVIVVETTSINGTALIDVTITFDYTVNGTTINKEGALLYTRNVKGNILEAIGGCEYSRE